MVERTTNTEVEGSVVSLLHVSYDDAGSEWERTVLSLATKDDLSISVDEDDEDFNPGTERRTRRYRTNNTIDVEISSAISTDMEALELLGIADTDGAINFDSDDRKILSENDEYIEIAYWTDDPDFETVDVTTDSELLHRLEDVEVVADDIDPSETPPTFDATLWVEGDFVIAADDDPTPA